jgi:hypothetical protein
LASRHPCVATTGCIQAPGPLAGQPVFVSQMTAMAACSFRCCSKNGNLRANA